MVMALPLICLSKTSQIYSNFITSYYSK